VLPGCGTAGAISLAERLLAGCTPACAPALPAGHLQTTSIGIAEYPVAARTPESLVSAADDALYRAKRSGRNQYCLAT
jgi:diguanylate cyclase (GGDEF)-like protein